jgi:hypothetical protein
VEKDHHALAFDKVRDRTDGLAEHVLEALGRGDEARHALEALELARLPVEIGSEVRTAYGCGGPVGEYPQQFQIEGRESSGRRVDRGEHPDLCVYRGERNRGDLSGPVELAVRHARVGICNDIVHELRPAPMEYAPDDPRFAQRQPRLLLSAPGETAHLVGVLVVQEDDGSLARSYVGDGSEHLPDHMTQIVVPQTDRRDAVEALHLGVARVEGAAWIHGHSFATNGGNSCKLVIRG